MLDGRRLTQGSEKNQKHMRLNFFLFHLVFGIIKLLGMNESDESCVSESLVSYKDVST